MSLSKIEVITQIAKMNGLKAALSKCGVGGMTVTQVLGCGVEKVLWNTLSRKMRRWSFSRSSSSALSLRPKR
ncbi:MAG: P-II family nitrogen regulator [Butyricicoccus porcorum]